MSTRKTGRAKKSMTAKKSAAAASVAFPPDRAILSRIRPSHAAPGLQGRRHDGKDPGEDPVDEGVGEGHPQGGEEADLGQDAEFAQQEQEKRPDRRQGGEDLPRLDLAGRLSPRDLAGAVEEEQIGDPQIHREGHDRPAEADRQDRERGEEKRADQKREDGPDRRREEREKPDEGPGKGDDEQKGDPERRQEDRRPHVPPRGVLVVQGGAVGPDRRQGEPGASGLPAR